MKINQYCNCIQKVWSNEEIEEQLTGQINEKHTIELSLNNIKDRIKRAAEKSVREDRKKNMKEWYSEICQKAVD